MFVFPQIHVLELYDFSFRLLGIELWAVIMFRWAHGGWTQSLNLCPYKKKGRLYQMAAISNEILSKTSYSSILMADTEK